MWVVLFHLQDSYGILDTLLPELSGFAAVTSGVQFRMDLLFMLSGFLISYVYIVNRRKLTPGAYGDFIAARLIRLYPVYLACSLLRAFLRGSTSGAAGTEFRVGLLLAFVGFLVLCVLVAKLVEAASRAYGHLLPSRRFWIILTILLTCTLVMACAPIAVHLSAVLGCNPRWTIVPVWLALVQAWPWVPRFGRPLGPVWFLSSLWFAYLFCFPVAWRLVHRLRSTWAALLWVFVPVILWLTTSQLSSLHELRLVTRACCGFLCGSALLVLYTKRSAFVSAAHKYLDATVLFFLVLSILIPAVDSETTRHAINFLLVLGVPFLLAGTTDGSSFTAKLLASRPMLRLGTISYSLFMSHKLAIDIWVLVLPSAGYANSSLLVRVLVMASYCGFILLAALGFYHFVEEPWVASLKNLVTEPRPRPARTSPLPIVAAQEPSS